MIIQLNIKDGKIVGGQDRLDKVIAHSMDGIYSVRFNFSGRPKNIQECRNFYFFICETVAKESDSGYKVSDLHELFKREVLTKLPDLQYLIKGNLMDYIQYTGVAQPPIINYSTKMLNIDGWFVYIDAVKAYIKEHLDFII